MSSKPVIQLAHEKCYTLKRHRTRCSHLVMLSDRQTELFIDPFV